MGDQMLFIPATLTVRKAVPKDFERIRECLSSSISHLSLPFAMQREMDFMAAPLESMQEERFYVVESSEEIIGHFFLWQMDPQEKCMQVVAGFVAGCEEKEVEDAFRRFFDILFQQKYMHKIMLMVDPDAAFFFTIARSLGLFLEGTFRKHISFAGSWCDVCFFSQLASEGIQKEIAITKDVRYEWLLSRARYDEIDTLVVRAVLLRMQPKQIEVLLLRRTKNVALPGVEETPGGPMVEGESVYDTLSREVKEKIGLEIEKGVTFLTSFDFTTDSGKRVREFVFRVKPTSWDVTIKKDEYGSFSWLPLQDLPKTKLHPDLVQILSSFSPTISYEKELSLVSEGDATIELIRPPSAKLEEALLVGLHLDAYAARGLNAIESIGFSLVDGTNRIVGGLVIDIAYGSLFLRRLWVEPSWRRLGWGRKLILRAESLAKEKGCAFALAHVMDWEDVPFFQKLGYSIESQVSGFQSDARMFRIRKELN